MPSSSEANAAPRSDAAWVVGLALGALLFHLLLYRGYGYFRDELYFLACSRHLDWGYVDQPPLVALAAWLGRRLFGETLFAIRFFPAVFGALTVWLAGTTARDLGGRRYAQVLACISVFLAPIFLGTPSYLSTDSFLPAVWTACMLVAVLIFRGGSPKLWLLFGALAGFGLEAKHALLFFGFAFVVALLLAPERKVFAQPWLWLGGLIALLLFLPNLIWEYRHDWATLELLRNIQRSNKNLPMSPLGLFANQFLLLDPLSAPIWLAGLGWFFFSREGKPYRALGWSYVVLMGLFTLFKSKVYYPTPVYPMFFAAGAVAIERWAEVPARRWVRGAAFAAVVIGGIVLAPLAKPLLPVETFIAYEQALHLAPPRTETHTLGRLPQQYADSFGWREMAASVAAVYNSLSPDERTGCAIFATNYGEAGAIDLFGPPYGLPNAISGHQNYFLWGPRGYTGQCVIVIGQRREDLERSFASVVLAARTQNDYAMQYENRPIWICRGFKLGTLADYWPHLKEWM